MEIKFKGVIKSWNPAFALISLSPTEEYPNGLILPKVFNDIHCMGSNTHSYLLNINRKSLSGIFF